MSFERYTSLTTGIEFRSRIGDRINPRSYCDDDTLGPVDIYINKAPVCKLKLTPTTQFATTNIAWDISQSVSSTSTIDTFDIDWGGATDIGNLSAQDWSSDPKSGNVQFDDIGKYLVVASVTDLLGETSKYCQTIVNIVDYVSLQRLYIGTTNNGIYVLEPGSDPLEANNGLSSGHLLFRSSRMNPAYKTLPTGQQHLWACTEDGLAYTIDGADNWSVISKATLGTPVNDAADDPAPATADLDQIDIAFDPTDPGHIIVLRTTTTRTWIYESLDYGATWSNYQVSTS